MHPSDGILRRFVDEPETIGDEARGHLAGCAGCRTRLEAMRDDAARLEARLGGTTNATAVDVEAAWRRLRSTPGAGRGRAWAGPNGPVWRWGAAGLAAAAAAAVAFTPVGSYASQVLTIFEPQTVTAVPVTSGMLTGALPDLRDYGTVTMPTSSSPRTATSAAQATTLAGGLAAPVPGVLPSGLGTPTYTVLGQQTGAFTFSAAKAEAAAAKAGQTAPAMPSGLNGTTVSVTLGPAIVAVYPGPGGGAAATGATGDQAALESDLAVLAMRAPAVSANGASAGQVESYLLSLPGVPPALAQTIRAITDPVQTLPIPVPVGQATSTSVTVDGVSGVQLSDTSGLYTAVVWEKGGVIYAVGGPYTATQVMAAAASVGQA